MSADAATVAPTKRGRRAWLVALAVVVAVVTIVLLANAPKSEPVKVWFVGTTNEAGEKRLVFEGTNATPTCVYYVACVATGVVRQAKIPSGLFLGYGLTSSIVVVQTNFYFTLNAPSNDLPYNVMWRFQRLRVASAPKERLRLAAFNFFRAHGMRGVAARIIGVPEWHYIPSTEIKE